MWIKRDFEINLDLSSCLEALFIRGPRQIGKSALLTALEPPSLSALFFDDMNVQQRAMTDPRFLLEQVDLPVLIDEAHLAPPIFFEIKRRIDASRRDRVAGKKALAPGSFRLTGSNQRLIDLTVKETLAGRVSIFYLSGLSVRELIRFDSEIKLPELFFRGGFPELWVRRELNPISFINDYISTFIEKDLAVSSGIEKRRAFLNVLQLSAARVGELLNYESLARDAGVAPNTVRDWISLLESNGIVGVISPYFTNLNKRVIKTPKIYFPDLGICTRLQSHQEQSSIVMSPQAGHLFESLVYAELFKTKQNLRLEYEIFFWRTKDQEEIDFVVAERDRLTLIEVKMSSGAASSFEVPDALRKEKRAYRKCVVVATGDRYPIDSETECVPIRLLGDYLVEG